MPAPHIQSPRAAGSSLLLARGVARGDGAALAAFYELWFPRIYSAARRLTGRDEAFCLDVVQEVILKVARKLRPMPSEQDLERWMLRVVRTTATDLLRRESRRARRERRRAVTLHMPEPAGQAEHAEALAWALRSAAALPQEDRALLAQRLGAGRTLEELGRDCGLSAGAVHGKVRRALQKLGRSAQERLL